MTSNTLSTDDAKERFKFLWVLLLSIMLDTAFICAWLVILVVGHAIFAWGKTVLPGWVEVFVVFEKCLSWVTAALLAVYIATDFYRIVKRIVGAK